MALCSFASLPTLARHRKLLHLSRITYRWHYGPGKCLRAGLTMDIVII
jgi:hypothetical protein